MIARHRWALCVPIPMHTPCFRYGCNARAPPYLPLYLAAARITIIGTGELPYSKCTEEMVVTDGLPNIVCTEKAIVTGKSLPTLHTEKKIVTGKSTCTLRARIELLRKALLLWRRSPNRV